MKPGSSPPTTGTKKGSDGSENNQAKPVETIQVRQEQPLISELEATSSIEINAFGKPTRTAGFGHVLTPLRKTVPKQLPVCREACGAHAVELLPARQDVVHLLAERRHRAGRSVFRRC